MAASSVAQEVIVSAVLRDKRGRTIMVQLKGSGHILSKDQLADLIEAGTVEAWTEAFDVNVDTPEATQPGTKHYEPAKVIVRQVRLKTKGRPLKYRALTASPDGTKLNNFDFIKEIDLADKGEREMQNEIDELEARLDDLIVHMKAMDAVNKARSEAGAGPAPT